MKIIQVAKEQRVYFSGLDPFEMLERKSLMSGICLGTAIDGDGTDIPTGLILYTLDQQAVIIHWLYVLPEYRGQGMGDALLSAAFDTASESGREYVCAYLSREYGRELICPNEEDYLRRHSFTKEQKTTEGGGRLLIASALTVGDEMIWETEPYDIFEKLSRRLQAEDEAEDTGVPLPASFGADDDADLSAVRERTQEDLVLTAADIAGCGLMKQKSGRQEAKSLIELTLPKLLRGIKRCLAKHPYEAFEGQLERYSPSWFDLELSSCITEEDEVCGLFLIHRDGSGAFWVEYLYDGSADSRTHLLLMLKRSASVFVEQYPPETEFIVRCYNAETKALTGNLFPDKK